MAFRLSVQYDNYCKEIIWKSSEGNSSFILAHTIAPASIRKSHCFYSSDLVNTAYHINQYILVSANQLFITVRNLLLLLIYHLLWRKAFVIVILQGGEGQGGRKANRILQGSLLDLQWAGQKKPTQKQIYGGRMEKTQTLPQAPDFCSCAIGLSAHKLPTANFPLAPHILCTE